MLLRPNVFWYHDGERLTQIPNRFHDIAKRAKVAFRCHDLRHRFASVFLQQTGDLAVLQMVLGHRSISMTLRYAHLLTDNLYASVAKLGTKSDTTTADNALETVAAS
jgi:site-specific recombinase XerD